MGLLISLPTTDMFRTLRLTAESHPLDVVGNQRSQKCTELHWVHYLLYVGGHKLYVSLQ